MSATLLLVGLAGLFAWAQWRARRAGKNDRWAAHARRLAWVITTTLAVYTASFFLMRATPGGPFDGGRALAPEIEARLRARYQLDLPVRVQWWNSVDALARLDLGPSMVLREFTVQEILVQSLPTSLLVGTAAVAWMILIGLPLGLLADRRAGQGPDAAASVVVPLGQALPTFVLAGLFVPPLVFGLGWLPAAGLESPAGLVLPSLCLGLPYGAQLARLLRAGLINTLDQDFVRTARAKGLGEARVISRYALRGALVPAIAFLGPAVAGILAGSLVVENLFGIPGLGSHFVQGALSRDYPLALGLVTIYTLLISISTWICDLLLVASDPRIELG